MGKEIDKIMKEINDIMDNKTKRNRFQLLKEVVQSQLTLKKILRFSTSFIRTFIPRKNWYKNLTICQS